MQLPRNDFYVYALFRPEGSVCYIGKGKGSRWRDSGKYVRNNNPHLAGIIKEAGGALPSAIIYRDLTEDQAFKKEIELISSIGRGEYGPLVNLTDGGDGGPGCRGDAHWNKLTHPEAAVAIGLALKGKMKSVTARASMSAAAKKRDRKAGYSEEHAAAISAGVARYWESRRKLGLPLTNRTEVGHKKHSETMRARYAARRARGDIKQDATLV